MSDRMEQVRDLLVDELRERGDIDAEDLVGEFLVLLAVHSHDDDGHLGWVQHLQSDEGLSSYVALGLMDHKRMQMQANMTEAYMKNEDDE